MGYNDIIDKVSDELGLPKKLVDSTYKAYWMYIKYAVEELPLKMELTQDSFNLLKTSVNIPSLGKLHCTYPRYLGMKSRFNIINKIRSRQ